jgi:hypothetical protein
MFKVLAVLCSLTYGGHVMECQKLIQIENGTMTESPSVWKEKLYETYDGCYDDAKIKYNQIAEYLKQYPNNFYTLNVSCIEDPFVGQ